MKTLREIQIGVLALVVAFSGLELGLFLRASRIEVQATGLEVRELVSETRGVIVQVKEAAAAVKSYSDSQMAVFSSQASKKSLRAGWDAAAEALWILHDVRQNTLPDVNQTLLHLDGAVGTLNGLIAHTDVSTQVLLGDADKALVNTAAALDDLSRTIIDARVRMASVANDLHDILTDPAVAEGLKNASAILVNVNGITAHGEEAMRSAPGIMKSVDRAASVGSKLTKTSIIVSIGATIMEAIRWLFLK